MQTPRYAGLRPTDPGGRNGLPNPERGWRIEAVVAEPVGAQEDMDVHGHARHLDGRISPDYNEHWWTLDARRYAPFGLTLAQTYCYLDKFAQQPISDEKLALIQGTFDNLRRCGLKSVLRFAYENGSGRRVGPTLDRILAHLDQLAPLIRGNADLIYVMQAGFVGAWGEWHSSTHKLEKDHGALAAIMAKVLDVLPPDRMTQVRVPMYKRWVLEQPILGGFRMVTAETAHGNAPAARIGLHNDGFLALCTCGDTWPEPPYYSNPGNPEFDYMTAECPYLPVDGEMYWNDAEGRIDGFKAIVRMRLHHYGSFSLWHSYSGREGRFCSIDEWLRTPLSEKEIYEARLPLSDGYFLDFASQVVPRMQFEYITDHLGYRFELQRAVFPATLRRTEPLVVDVELINRGFAVLHNPRPVCFVLVDDGNNVTEFPVPGAKPADWQPFMPGDETYAPWVHRFGVQAPLPSSFKPGWYQLGLWMPDASPRLRTDPRYAVRLANRDTPWWTDGADRYGVNLIGVVEITK